MNLEFFMFDVNEGQAVAVQLPNRNWCMFDVGRSAGFSPSLAVRRRATTGLAGLALARPFAFYKATISHLHGDHLGDHENLLTPPPTYFRTVDYDVEYLDDVAATSSSNSTPGIAEFCRCHMDTYRPATTAPDYGVATIRELGLSVSVARALGGAANSRVNNASIVTRIDCYGHSILICGDMEKEAWDFVLTYPPLAQVWKPFVSSIDVLVAPHHGHASGYSTELMTAAAPRVVLISVASKDPSVDSRYSGDAVGGITIDGQPFKAITTRANGGHISFSIMPPEQPNTKGKRTWTL